MTEDRVLLQTDLVDSTLLSEQLGDAAMTTLWAMHDHGARQLLRERHGREIDKSDGFLLLFENVADALDYALAYHRLLSSLPHGLQARAGLHVGPVMERENDGADVAQGAKPLELDGIAKPTTARVMSVARGGQTLLTASAVAALGQTAVPLRALGHWRLKGLEEPIELYQADSGGAEISPPADTDKAWRVVARDGLWLPKRELRHTLPAERDAFIGRREALRELAQHFKAGTRLVSVAGMGGSGKTRLAKRFGWAWLGDFAGGAWFCDLSQADSLDGVVHAVAQGLEVVLDGSDPLAQLGDVIAGRGPCLVIIDNFEQVARHAEATLGRWLDRALEARFVVTTRQVLGIPGEAVMALDPLPPAEGEALFVRRAEAGASGRQLAPEDRAAIGQLVRLLDGLPLAIELAAARVRVLTPRALLERMGARLKLLTSAGGRRDRQATLRATLDWSWDMLSPAEQLALAQLAAFEGGFALDSAEAVLDLASFDADADPTDLVQALVDKSLVRRQDRERFAMLGTVHEYVSARAGPELALAQARHGEHFARAVERGTLADAGAEIENLVAASRRAVARADGPCAVATLEGAWSVLKRTGPFGAAVEQARACRERLQLDDRLLADAAWVEGSALFMSGRDAEAIAILEAGVAAARTGRSQRSEARLVLALGEARSAIGQVDAARALLDEARELAVELADPQLECWALNALGASCNDLGLVDEARGFYSAALGLARQLDDRRWLGGLLGNLGSLHYGAGMLELATANYREALALTIEGRDRRWEGNTRCNLGLALHEMGQSVEGAELLHEALGIARHLGHARLEWGVLCNLGIVADARGELAPARAFHEQALAVARRLADGHAQGQTLGYLSIVHARAGRFDDAEPCLHAAARLLEPLHDRWTLTWLRSTQAEHALLLGRRDEAWTFLAEARALARDLGVPPASELGRRIARLDADAALGERASCRD